MMVKIDSVDLFIIGNYFMEIYVWYFIDFLIFRSF